MNLPFFCCCCSNLLPTNSQQEYAEMNKVKHEIQCFCAISSLSKHTASKLYFHLLQSGEPVLFILIYIYYWINFSLTWLHLACKTRKPVYVAFLSGDLAPHLGRPLLGVFLQGTKDPDQSVRASSLSNLGELCQRLDYALGPLAQEVRGRMLALNLSDRPAVKHTVTAHFGCREFCSTCRKQSKVNDHALCCINNKNKDPL